MRYMDSPVDQEFIRINANIIAQEEEKEDRFKSLKKHGIPCDGCEELFMYEQLDTVDDDGDIRHICKDC